MLLLGKFNWKMNIQIKRRGFNEISKTKQKVSTILGMFKSGEKDKY